MVVLMSNESEAFKKGEMLIGGGTENGGVANCVKYSRRKRLW